MRKSRFCPLNLLGVLFMGRRELFKHAIATGLIDTVPARDVSPIRVKTDDADPWPAWALDLVHEHARWEIRNAVMLALYTGQRTSDVVRMT